MSLLDRLRSRSRSRISEPGYERQPERAPLSAARTEQSKPQADTSKREKRMSEIPQSSPYVSSPAWITQKILLEGYLKKRQAVRKSWVNRYYMLYKDMMVLCTKKQGKLLGIIPLVTFHYASVLQEKDGCRWDFLVKGASQTHTFYFLSPTPHEAQQWVATVKKLAELVALKNGGRSLSSKLFQGKFWRHVDAMAEYVTLSNRTSVTMKPEQALRLGRNLHHQSQSVSNMPEGAQESGVAQARGHVSSQSVSALSRRRGSALQLLSTLEQPRDSSKPLPNFALSTSPSSRAGTSTPRDSQRDSTRSSGGSDTDDADYPRTSESTPQLTRGFTAPLQQSADGNRPKPALSPVAWAARSARYLTSDWMGPMAGRSRSSSTDAAYLGDQYLTRPSRKLAKDRGRMHLSGVLKIKFDSQHGMLKRWQRRYFALYDEVLVYYKQRGGDAVGHIPLPYIRSIKRDFSSRNCVRFTVLVKSPRAEHKSSWCFLTKTALECEQWVTALSIQLELNQLSNKNKRSKEAGGNAAALPSVQDAQAGSEDKESRLVPTFADEAEDEITRVNSPTDTSVTDDNDGDCAEDLEQTAATDGSSDVGGEEEGNEVQDKDKANDRVTTSTIKFSEEAVVEDRDSLDLSKPPSPRASTCVPAVGSVGPRFTVVTHVTQPGFIVGMDKNNQDSFARMVSIKGDHRRALFAVFDGHGPKGDIVSQFIAKHLPGIIANHELLDSNPIDALKKSFSQCNALLMEQPDIDTQYSGSTGILVYIHGNMVYSANTGDSRAVLAKKMDEWECAAVPLSNDHKPSRPDEKTRIEAAGGRVEPKRGIQGDIGSARVWKMDQDIPGLAVSRAFGDTIARSVGVMSEPEVWVRQVQANDAFIILASDGVWEFITNEEAVDIVAQADDRQAAKKELLEEANKRWAEEDWESRDDITFQIVYLRGNGGTELEEGEEGTLGLEDEAPEPSPT